MAQEKKLKKPPTLKRDPISIMVYVIVALILYFLVGILLKIVYLSMLLPPFNAMRNNIFMNNPLHFPARFVYDLMYHQAILSVLTTIFNYITLFIMLLYIIWKILQMIPLLGPALLAIIPPFRAFEEAGIFALIDDILGDIAKYLPKSVVKVLRSIFIDMVQFTKDKLTDIILLINPKVEIEEGQFDKFLADMERKNVEGFAVESFTNTKPINQFVKDTEESMAQKNLADRYKGLESVKPDMEMTDRMQTTFNNEMKKIRIQLDNTPNTIKMQLATLP